MDPTLTLQIPFLFLGRKDLVDRDLWSPKERDIRPVHQIYHALRHFCPNVPVQLWTPGNAGVEGGAQNSTGWVIRPLPSTEGTRDSVIYPGILPVWCRTDANLTIGERAQLGANVWVCPVLLQRFGIPLSTTTSEWQCFEQEATEVLSVLKSFEDWTDTVEGVEGPVHWWNVVCSEKCWMSVAVEAGADSTATPSLDAVVVKKVLLAAAAFERELTTLSTPSALVEFWGLSRYLEYRGVRRLAKERLELWDRLKGENRLSGKSRVTMFHRDKEKWMSGFDDEDIACERTQGRRREWWDVVDALNVEELLVGMKGFEENGRRLAVSCKVASRDEEPLMPTSSHDGFESRNSIELHKSEGLGGYHDQSAEPFRAHMQTSKPPAAASSVIFQGHRSTRDLDEIIAYTELIASLVRLAHNSEYNALKETFEKFRNTTVSPGTKPLEGLEQLMAVLDVSGRTTRFWKDSLSPHFKEQDDCNASATEYAQHSASIPRPCDSYCDPFAPLRRYIISARESEKAHMPTFIKRYDSAGGFVPTTGKKLYVLMVAEEHARSGRYGEVKRAESSWVA